MAYRVAPHLGADYLLREYEDQPEGTSLASVWREKYAEELTLDAYRKRIYRARDDRDIKEGTTARKVPYGAHRSGKGCDRGCRFYEVCELIVSHGYNNDVSAEKLPVVCCVPVGEVVEYVKPWKRVLDLRLSEYLEMAAD